MTDLPLAPAEGRERRQASSAEPAGHPGLPAGPAGHHPSPVQCAVQAGRRSLGRGLALAADPVRHDAEEKAVLHGRTGDKGGEEKKSACFLP